jgi:hypothetical protein
MIKFRRKTAQVLGAGLMAASGLGLVGLTQVSQAAHADPSWASFHLETGVGSDTIQDVFDAYSGAANGTGYAALTSSAAHGSFQVSSFDAFQPGTSSTTGCITTKAGGSQFLRPNGSTYGREALSDLAQGLTWPQTGQALISGAVDTSCNAGASVALTGAVDFARSSAGPAAGDTGTVLTYVPFAHDAVSAAYYDGYGDGAVATLTQLQIHNAYLNGTVTLGNGDVVAVCLPQAGSGTRKFWATVTGDTDAQMEAAAATTDHCTDLEEHNGNAFGTFAATAGAQATAKDWIFPMSVAQWISQSNGRGADRSNTFRDICAGACVGKVDVASVDVANNGTVIAPYTGSYGTGPNGTNPGNTLAANSPFYSSTFGRNVYAVVPTNKISGRTADQSLIDLFSGSTSQICATGGQATAAAFGFDASLGASCGATTLTGSYIS